MKKRFLLLLTTFTVIISHFSYSQGYYIIFIFSGRKPYLHSRNLALPSFTSTRLMLQLGGTHPCQKCWGSLYRFWRRAHCTSMGRHQNRFVCQRRIEVFKPEFSGTIQGYLEYSPFFRTRNFGIVNRSNSSQLDSIVFPVLIMCPSRTPKLISESFYPVSQEYPATQN